ncbi:MAG: hypothetical protein CMH49_07865 [Myxococcales bacterium]|nr:hypothetical protein [Myxococcales bacterium]
MKLHKLLISSFSISLILPSCFQGPEPAPNCFAIDGEISFDAKAMALRYQKRSSAYCSYDTQACVEVWTGLSKQEIIKNPKYLIQYPYLALLDKKAISSSSLYSECYLPVCQSPECECETNQDCSEDSLCMGLGLLGVSPQKTRCLQLCDETSSCYGGTPNSYCSVDDCLISNL